MPSPRLRTQASTVALVRAMNRAGVNRLIFSSSCATFGAPTTFPITETTPQRPTNPYGQAKLQAEQAIVAFLKAQERQHKSFSAALLRYFNVVGADPLGRLGPHLVHVANHRYPRILDATYEVALGIRPALSVTGDSFPTKDGSAQRDYIHVTDLVDAHVLLMFALRGNDLLYYNVGNGKPYTVLEIVEVARKISGREIKVQMKPARPGDPPILYTDPAKIRYEIGWRPRFPDIESIVRHGWEWRLKHYGVPPAPSIDPLQHNRVSFTAENDTAPRLKDNPRIVIVGAGPTGLCAAWRLHELGYSNWELLEGSTKPAGLACTIQDDKGFGWDIGVHCLFSHFQFFDALLDDMLPPKDWLYHQRYSPARMRDTWVGYPVQANVWRLPEKEVMGILADLAQKDARPKPPPPRNFKDFLEAKFGNALTETFMAPYNAKVWAHPAHEMNHIWVGERVAEIKSSAVFSNVINRRDAPKWGPNAQFRYPMNGTGHIWVKVFEELPKKHKTLGARVKAIRTKKGQKAIELADGRRVPFDGMLSTMPLPELLRMTPDKPELAKLAEGNNGAADHSRFKHQTVNLVGVGIWGTAVPAPLDGVHWVYFPESDFIFYRVTVLSNFSPLVVAKPYKQWSLLVEVSESRHRKVPQDVEELKRVVIDGLHRGGMLPRNATIASVWTKRLPSAIRGAQYARSRGR
jgi:UDP-glucose 4-epimerase/protoporphyrinogen oxidase